MQALKRMPGNRREGTTVRLARELNLLDCFSLVVGVIIGSGIFISPKGVLLNVDTVGWFLLIWAFAGIFNCLGALSYVELATSIPLSGGDYTYLRLSFGYMIAFLRVWTIIVAVRTGPLTLLSITAGTYIVGDSAVCLQTAVRIFAACILCKLLKSYFRYICADKKYARTHTHMYTNTHYITTL